MNKAAFVDRIAYEADIQPSEAKRALEAIVIRLSKWAKGRNFLDCWVGVGFYEYVFNLAIFTGKHLD